MNIGAIGSNCHFPLLQNNNNLTTQEMPSRAEFAKQLANKLIQNNNQPEIGPSEFLSLLRMKVGNNNIKALEERFKKFDADGSGALNEAELANLLQSAPLKTPELKIEHLQKELSLLNSLASLVQQKENLSKQDLIEQIISSLTSSTGANIVSDTNAIAEEIANKIFARLDKNGDGALDANEIQSSQQELRTKIAELQAQNTVLQQA